MTHSPLQPQLEESSLLNKINRSNPKSWILYRNPNVTAHGLCLLSWELVGRAGELCCVWASCCRAKASSACGASPAVTFALMTSSWVPGCYLCVLFWFLLCVCVLVGCVGFFVLSLASFPPPGKQKLPLEVKRQRALFSWPSCLAFSSASLTWIYSCVQKSRTSLLSWSQSYF